MLLQILGRGGEGILGVSDSEMLRSGAQSGAGREDGVDGSQGIMLGGWQRYCAMPGVWAPAAT